ncbi:MAG TPA: hypothetical protein VGI23_21375 [Steroidobacteraceae bacterium]
MPRGRKSAASLSIVPSIPGQGRPPPPANLDRVEKKIWRDVVAALPDYSIDSAAQLVLKRLVTQAAIAERREQRLREMRATDQDATEAAVELINDHCTTAKAVTYLLAALRATPKSRVRASTSNSLEERTLSRPWEIKARA